MSSYPKGIKKPIKPSLRGPVGAYKDIKDKSYCDEIVDKIQWNPPWYEDHKYAVDDSFNVYL
jgi:hypothetical protein